jgi:hypothetical protein
MHITREQFKGNMDFFNPETFWFLVYMAMSSI